MRLIKKIIAIFMICSIVLSMGNIREVKAVNVNQYNSNNDAVDVFKEKYSDKISEMKEIRAENLRVEANKFSIKWKNGTTACVKVLYMCYADIYYTWNDGSEDNILNFLYDIKTGESYSGADDSGDLIEVRLPENSNPFIAEILEEEPTEVTEEAPATGEITIYAKSLETKLAEGGNLYFIVTFSDSIKVVEAPILKVKINGQTRNLVYQEQEDKKIIYCAVLNNVNECTGEITFESLEGGEIHSKWPNTTTTIDYEEQFTVGDLGKVENFIFVDENARGDINKDGRIDELDVEEILSCEDKKIADVNGDNEITPQDKADLQKAIEERDIKYVNYLEIGDLETAHGDVATVNGASETGDGIIDYHDVEEIVRKIGKDLSANEKERYDVDGNGKIDIYDAICVEQAIRSQDAMYIMNIKVNEDSYADLCQDEGEGFSEKGVINIKDILKIGKVNVDELSEADKQKYDINGDGKINLYDQIALVQGLYSNDLSKTKYFRVFEDANGDVNHDGFIDYRDAKLIAKYIAHDHIQLDLSKADVNNDKEVNIYDLVKITQALEEADNSFESKCELLDGVYFKTLEEMNGKGDLDGNGIVNYYDAKIIAKSLLSSATSLSVDVADVNLDEKVDLYDAIYIMKKLNGLDDKVQDITDIVIKGIATEAGKNGDINRDGIINELDAEEIAKLLASNTPIESRTADVNKDGTVDIYDVIKIMKEVVNHNIENRIIYGDVNQDNQLNMFDVLALNNYLLNPSKYPLTEVGLKAADLTGDGQVNTSDSTIMLNYVVEIVDYYTLIDSAIGQSLK